MKKSFVLLALLAGSIVYGQKANPVISAGEVERIERVLAADSMMGRRTGSAGIDKAAKFIAEEFGKAGLQTWNNSGSYLQSFKMVRPKFISISGVLDGVSVDAKKVIAITSKKELTVTDKSGYEVKTISPGANLFREAYPLLSSGKSYLVWVDESFAKDFGRLTQLKRQMFASENSTVFILTSTQPKAFEINAKHDIEEIPMANVVGVLPGKSRPEEIVIFSAHHDHIGTGKPVNGDTIYNGANDDAAGTTAVIMLAKYFKQLNNNERTLVFATFTAEEIGGFGSQYFSRLV